MNTNDFLIAELEVVLEELKELPKHPLRYKVDSIINDLEEIILQLKEFRNFHDPYDMAR